MFDESVTFVDAAIVLLILALAASYLPIRRAAQLDPAKALHS